MAPNDIDSSDSLVTYCFNWAMKIGCTDRAAISIVGSTKSFFNRAATYSGMCSKVSERTFPCARDSNWGAVKHGCGEKGASPRNEATGPENSVET